MPSSIDINYKSNPYLYV